MHAFTSRLSALAGVGLLLVAAAAAAPLPPVKVLFLVEHDPFTLTCSSDAQVPPQRGHGFGPTWRRYELRPDATYEIRGDMGWSARLTVGREKVTGIGEVTKGPRLATAPKAFVAADGAVEVQLGRVPDFQAQIPLEYGAWEVPGAYASRVGFRRLELPDGAWDVQGRDWLVPLRVEQGQLWLAGDPTGLAPATATITADTLRLAPKPGALPPPATPPVLRALLTETSLRPDGSSLTTVSALPELPPRGGTPASLSAEAFWAVGRGSDVSGGKRLEVVVVDDGKSLLITPVYLTGGKGRSHLDGTLRALDESSLFPSRKVQLNAGKTTFASINPAAAGLYELRLTAVNAQDVTDVLVSVVFAHRSPAAASLWLPQARTCFTDREAIDVAVWATAPAEVRLVATREGQGDVVLAEPGRNGTVVLPPFSFAPGDVRLELRRGADVLARRTLSIVPGERPSRFAVMAYGNFLGSRTWREDIDKMQRLGIRGCLDQAGTMLASATQCTGLATSLAAVVPLLPDVGPADRYAASAPGLLDRLDRLGWQYIAQWGCAHQPWGVGMSWGDPVVQARLAASSAWIAMQARRHPAFLGINLFDEGGTARGPRMEMDGTSIEYEHFRQAFGRAKPTWFGEDDAAARAWIYDKQEQMNAVYRATADVMADLNRLADPAAALTLGTQNGNLNSMAVDGGHPPLAYRALTRSTMHYYPVWRKSGSLMGNEYHFMLPSAAGVEFTPLIDANGSPSASLHEVSLMLSRQVDGLAYFHWDSGSTWSLMPTTHQAFFLSSRLDQEALARQHELTPDQAAAAHRAGQEWVRINERLETYGDFFRTIRRDRAGEIGVLYSLYSFAPRLFPKPDDPGYAYSQAWHAAGTAYYATSALLRAGMQAGWLSDEEILERDGLRGRKVIVLAQITAMRPELQAKLEAFVRAGGSVFADLGTTVTVAGARPLPLDFGRLWEDSTYERTVPGSAGKAAGPTVKTWLDTLTLGKVVPVLQDQISALVRGRVENGAPLDLLVTRQVNGDSVYFLGVNEKYSSTRDLPALRLHDRTVDVLQPLECRLLLPAMGVVYDVLAGSEVGRASGIKTIRQVKLAPGELVVYAVLPDAIGKLELSVAKDAPAQAETPVTVRLLGASGKLLSAAVPLEIRVTDAQTGTAVRPTLYRSTDRGEWHGSLAPGAFDPAVLRVQVRELITRREAVADVTVAARPPVAAVLDKPAFIENAGAVDAFLRGLAGRSVYVVLGDATPAAVAEPLQAALAAHRVEVRLWRASQVTGKSFDTHVGRGVYRLDAPILAGSQATPEIDAPVIAIGSPADHALIRHATWERTWTGRLSLGAFPGPGQAYITHLWRPFSLRENSVLVSAGDDAGLRAGVAALVERLAAVPPPAAAK